jgi:hypothetical protein
MQRQLAAQQVVATGIWITYEIHFVNWQSGWYKILTTRPDQA